jgi:hypothetical protein
VFELSARGGSARVGVRVNHSDFSARDAKDHCEPINWQRCGCKPITSDAESSSAPSPIRRIEDVHRTETVRVTCPCATQQQSATAAQAQRVSSKHHTPPITAINTHYAPIPPANIASPSFGSDVAAKACRATLRAAVLQVPLVALKMSTVLRAVPVTVQHNNN